jgi:hypothetical protein
MHSSGVTWYFKSTVGSLTFPRRILFARIIETHCNLTCLSLKQHTLTDNFSETSPSYRLRNEQDNKREVAKLGIAMLLQGEQLRCVSRYFTWINPSSSFFLYSFLRTMLQLSRRTLEFMKRSSAECCWFAPTYPTARTVVVLLWSRESSMLASKFYVFYWPNVYYRLPLVSTGYTEWIPRPLSYPVCFRSTSTLPSLKFYIPFPSHTSVNWFKQKYNTAVSVNCQWFESGRNSWNIFFHPSPPSGKERSFFISACLLITPGTEIANTILEPSYLGETLVA